MSAKNKNKLFEQYLDYEDVTPNCIVVNFDILPTERFRLTLNKIERNTKIPQLGVIDV